VSALTSLVSQNLGDSIAKDVKEIIKDNLLSFDFAVKQYEQFWLTHVGWKATITTPEGIKRAYNDLEARTKEAKDEFERNSAKYEQSVRSIDAKFADQIKKLTSDFIFDNTVTMVSSVLSIFDSASIPTNEAEATLEAVKLIGKATDKAKDIKDKFEGAVNSFSDATAAAHAKKKEELEKVQAEFFLASRTFTETTLNIAGTKASLVKLQSLDSLKM
jgi:hypothetical protein